MLNKSKLPNIKNDLLKYVHQKTNYSYKKIMEKIGIDNNDDFYYVICKILQSFIDEFNFETPVSYYKYIYKLTEYLKQENVYLENEKAYIKKLKNTNTDILNKINKNTSKTENALNNEQMLMDIYHEIDEAINIINYGKVLTLNDDETIYNIIKEMIFKLSNANYIDELLKKCPDIIFLKNGDQYLFEEICDKYFNVLLNKDDDNELIYYDKIVNAFISYSKNNEDIKNIILYRSNKMLEKIDGRDIVNKQKKLFYLKNLNNKLLNDKEKYDIDKLNIKYNLVKFKQLNKYKLIKPDYQDYKSNNKYILTFDSKETGIFENAISLNIGRDGKIHLGYYITDIASYLNQNEDLKKIVYDNAFSVKGFPLLPDELKEKINLKQGKRRKVIAFLFEFDKQLNVTNFKIEKQNIKVKHNLTFDDLKNILNYPIDTKLKVTSSNLYRFSKCILSKKNWNEIDSSVSDKNIGAIMINNYQVFLNYFISNYCCNKDLPFIYRNNELGKENKQMDILKNTYRDNIKANYIFDLINYTNCSWYYSTVNKGHDGLKLDSYSEVTRPARSLASIINQELLIKYFIDGAIINKEEKEKLNNELNKLVVYMNEKTELYNNYLYESKKIKAKK